IHGPSARDLEELDLGDREEIRTSQPRGPIALVAADRQSAERLEGRIRGGDARDDPEDHNRPRAGSVEPRSSEAERDAHSATAHRTAVLRGRFAIDVPSSVRGFPHWDRRVDGKMYQVIPNWVRGTTHRRGRELAARRRRPGPRRGVAYVPYVGANGAREEDDHAPHPCGGCPRSSRPSPPSVRISVCSCSILVHGDT